ncbi:CoA pyrophosphatase [Pseudaquabacterium rugosum]|uniref:CoA pyrophosphatase n=1 Tax=Pseudaquabacterium rugosum TaxID=2984194 RepID=A0ABU9B7T8_9BURK
MSVNSPCPAPRQAAADAAPLPSRPPRVRDPRAASVVAVDRHLPALPRSLLCADALRTLLARPEAALWPPELRGDGQRAGAPDDREAAVLLGLRPALDGQGGLQVLLTERTAHLRQHAGQIAFPGGRQDPQDADARATALREAHEEVGLAPSAVEVIGCLPVYVTVTGYRVTPVIGLIAPEAVWRPEPGEVAEVFEVPLAFLMDPAHHRHHEIEVDGQLRRFLSMPWTDPSGGRERWIWGATAAMLRNFWGLLHRLQWLSQAAPEATAVAVAGRDAPRAMPEGEPTAADQGGGQAAGYDARR